MITQSDGTFTITLGQQIYGPYPTREQAQTALYDLERGQAPAALACLSEPARVIAADAAAALLDYLSQRLAEGSTSVRELIDHAVRVASNRSELPDAAVVVLAHLDQIAKTEEERAYVREKCERAVTEGDVCILDWARRLTSIVEWCGVQTSPGVNRDRASTETARQPRRCRTHLS
jgi:hypothetical protein